MTLPENAVYNENQMSELQKGALVALQRAAEEARQIAIQTNTGIVVLVDGEIKHITADELMKSGQTSTQINRS
jgi:hypothetical protein